MAWDFKSDRSIYKQIIDNIKFKILSGALKPGDKVGSVRELAKLAAVNPNTMQKALSELERLGFVYKERSKGRYITKDLDLINKTKDEYAHSLVNEFFNQMGYIGYKNKQIKEIIMKKCEEDK